MATPEKMNNASSLDAQLGWSALQDEFDAETFRLAMVQGQDPDGTQLNTDMPRWNIGNDDLADLIAYLKTLPQVVSLPTTQYLAPIAWPIRPRSFVVQAKTSTLAKVQLYISPSWGRQNSPGRWMWPGEFCCMMDA